MSGRQPVNNKLSSISSLDYSFAPAHAPIGCQMLFVAFGSLVLVPLLTGLDPSVALFTAGAGTLLFQVVTRGKVPVFLASSFAFILPIQHGVAMWGAPAALGGLATTGLVYFPLSFMIYKWGMRIVDRVFPPIVTGSVIIVIGLSLAPVAINMALGLDSGGERIVPRAAAMTISMISLAVTIVASILGKGFVRLVPILCGVVAGYAASLVCGVVDYGPVVDAHWLAVPRFIRPEWNLNAVLYMIPIAIAPAIEHIGDIFAISAVTGRDYVKNPGLHRTLLGDGLATSLASMLGGPPNTTYSEVTGGVALTRAFNPGVMTWAAISALCLAFVGKLGALLMTIPTPVMGGIMILLFGTIAVVGMNTLVRSGRDLMEPRNLVIVSITLVFGLGGMVIDIGDMTLSGIGLAGISGLALHLIIPGGKGD